MSINHSFNTLLKRLLVAILGFGVILICFLSWKKNPDLTGVDWIPGWISDWGDLSRNSSKRTGIPFLFMGISVGLILRIQQNLTMRTMILYWLYLVIFIIIVEAVQLMIPTRYPDIKDVGWGALGAGVGLGLVYAIRFNPIR